ncbi:MAG: glycosyltransferase family 2 protein [Patescibacteria group bacterium]
MGINQSAKIYVGFVTYNSTANYLPYFLPSLKTQSFKDFKIITIDNSEQEKNENLAYIKNNFPEIDLKWAGGDLGFGKAYNLMINQAIKDGVKYFLTLTPDVILEPNIIEEMLKVMESDNKIAVVAPKILKWDFENKIKTNIVDSYGIICDRKFRFRDNGQGQQDNKIDGKAEEIFGFTGAAVMFNLKALEDVTFYNGSYKEYFDELMFMYKEDCDLSLRLRLAGWNIKLASAAVAYHDRTASRVGDSMRQIIKNRTGKKRKIKIWSFQGQWILVLKYSWLNFSLKTKFNIWWYQFKILAFTILFEQYLLKELVGIWKIKKLIKKRKEQLKIRINISEIEKLFV